MKIIIDGVWGGIKNADTGKQICDFGDNNFALYAIIDAALTPSQQNTYYTDSGITFVISKKKEKAMYAEIDNQKRIFRIT